jgi:hypothetical protein
VRSGLLFREARWRDWLAVASLVGLAIAFLYRTVLGNLMIYGLDLFTYFYPYRAYLAEAARSGHLPLWNPYLFMGVPLLANIQSQVLYPLNLPLYWLSVPKMLSLSITIHLFLAAAFAYGFARRVLALAPLAASVSAITLAFGGFLGAQAGHPNQLSVLAWLPLLLWLFFLAFTQRRVRYALLGSLVVAVQFLAGHTQSSYINLAALGCYCLYLPSVHLGRSSAQGSLRRQLARGLGRSLGLFALIGLLGAAIAAVQLLPTLELSRLSIRGAGLPYREAVSFSLDPTVLHRALLPNLGEGPFTEYVAYVGILPLLLAFLATWRRGHDGQARFFIALALTGLFLAVGVYNPFYYVLYRLVPGFGLFRVPARWLYLYVVGMAFLAGFGFQELVSLSRKLGKLDKRCLAAGASLGFVVLVLSALNPPGPALAVYWVVWTALGGALLWLGLRRQQRLVYLMTVACLVGLELFLASRYLPYNQVTAPQAFSSLRTSVANLLTDTSTYRFLSFSGGSFDPGDLSDIQEMLGGQLPEEAIYDYLVATKQKEILTPNLPLLYERQSIDGYDGGVLPLARYVEWERLLLPEDEVSIDGRLQGRITEMPAGRLLDMLNVKYVLTDKVHDLWVDGAYYDLGQRAILGEGGTKDLVLSDLPSFPATAVGVISYLVGAEDVEQGASVAELTFTERNGRQHTLELRAGVDTAEGEYAATAQHRQGRVVGRWRNNPAGNDYYALLELSGASYLKRIRVRWLANQGQLRLRGMTLLDQRTGTHRALVVSTEGSYRLVHSGDVKIYQNLDVLPRAYLVHEVRFVDDDSEVLSDLKGQAFDPASEVLLSAEQDSVEEYGASCEDRVRLLSYAPERIDLRVEAGCAGYLVITDADYPGWVALVDGSPEEIRRANFYFRAVFVPEGSHRVEFMYLPGSLQLGLAVSLMASIAFAGGMIWQEARYRRAG